MDNDGKDLPGLSVWMDRMQLTAGEAASIRSAIVTGDAAPHDGWLERLTSRIDRTVARNGIRLDRAVGDRWRSLGM